MKIQSRNIFQGKQKFLIFILLFGIAGGLYVLFSFAATSAKFIEPETNTISGNASLISDATASNNQYVLFEACPAGQTGTPPNCTTPPPAPTVTLTASPTSVNSGTGSTLTWSSTNTTACTASGSWTGTKATSGSQSTGNLTASQTYTLTCTGAGGSANASAGVSVTVAGTCTNPTHTPGGPDSWGGCWPGPNNTGVPAGTSLTTYTGPCTITANNTVIDAKIINCDMIIQAANVQVTRSRFNNGSIETDENSTGYSFTITDSEVNIGNRAGTGVGAVNFTATRVRVTGGNRSMHCWNNCTITDSYVHGQFTDPSGTFHESGIRMGQSATFRHNSIICDAPDVPPDGGCSADLTGYGDFGPVQNNTIDKNLFGATTGGYCSYGGSSSGKPYSSQTNHIVFTNNVWQKGTKMGQHGYTCGYYGSNTAFDPAKTGNVWTNNKYDDGTVVTSSN